jgi:hypothetical protein
MPLVKKRHLHAWRIVRVQYYATTLKSVRVHKSIDATHQDPKCISLPCTLGRCKYLAKPRDWKYCGFIRFGLMQK